MGIFLDSAKFAVRAHRAALLEVEGGLRPKALGYLGSLFHIGGVSAATKLSF